MPPIIRPAADADLPAVLDMVEAICAMHRGLDPARFDFLPDIRDRYARWLPQRSADSRSVYLVAEVGGKPAGFIVASVLPEIPIYTRDSYAWVHDLWVEPQHRGTGLGLALARECVARFSAMGVRHIRLETARANAPARNLFAQLGFRETTIEMMRDGEEGMKDEE